MVFLQTQLHVLISTSNIGPTSGFVRFFCSAVFEDVYNVVIYALEEHLAAEVRDQVVALWHQLVEPYFGRDQRQYLPLHTKAELQVLWGWDSGLHFLVPVALSDDL